jgi:hypothetical protein
MTIVLLFALFNSLLHLVHLCIQHQCSGVIELMSLQWNFGLISFLTRIFIHLQENSEWMEWQATVLQERNAVENVYRWACGYAIASYCLCLCAL